MILVVEGISASGKSSWCAEHAPDHMIAENGRLHAVPDRASDPAGAARFWAERNADRWQAALAMEGGQSYAVCDTDPLKLHYIWSLWQIGEAAERDWWLGLAATRQTVAEGRIGFADGYLVGTIEPEAARNRALADPTRRRRNFELHVRLQPALLAWYAALDAILPGRVRIDFPSEMPSIADQGGRYDLAAFDAMIEALPKPPIRPSR
ncbi:hypothetical protein Q4F19_18785 [Sphingomonas sp. BIUV-7]|uniref:Thymidylate kinase n=1 Tax=Sphingomonas natans TaxID=3063330 RepID=A0ABT8YDL0_9SPHN|nr:hypothetical protein [Sphingomonas sp. BIUV-7]MDO6416437.1 hypothetical protein [Sphingomonas sp. BIUV-7]